MGRGGGGGVPNINPLLEENQATRTDNIKVHTKYKYNY